MRNDHAPEADSCDNGNQPPQRQELQARIAKSVP